MFTIRDLQQLMVLAEELSFSRAADRLNVSQSALSQTVKRMEREVDGLLVERTTRRSRLTPAGEALVEGARQVLADLARLEQATRDIAAGRAAAIRLGSVNPAMRVLMPRVLRAVRESAPDVRISLHPASSHAQLRMLVDGQLDVGVLRVREVPSGLAVEPLMHEPLYAALPAWHPLCAEPAVSLSDLDGADFVMAPRERNPLFYDELIGTFSRFGCSPRHIVEADDMWAQLATVGAGGGVAVLPLLFVDQGRDDVVFRPLPHRLELPLAVVYAQSSPSAAVAALLGAARTEATRLLDVSRRATGSQPVSGQS